MADIFHPNGITGGADWDFNDYPSHPHCHVWFHQVRHHGTIAAHFEIIDLMRVYSGALTFV